MNLKNIESQKYKWIGVVLAGGRSSRMGVDKRTLVFEEKTLLDRAAGLLGQIVGDENVLISGSAQGNLATVPDVQKEIGPIGGIQSILLSNRVQEGDWMLLAPVDMPGLSNKVLENLKRAAEESVADDFFGIQFEEHELPVAFPISFRLRQAVSKLLDPQRMPYERSLRSLWKQLDFHSLALPSGLESCFRNLNTMEDWNRFLKGAHESKIR